MHTLIWLYKEEVMANLVALAIRGSNFSGREDLSPPYAIMADAKAWLVPLC